ncbi:MAG: Minf_1886 family protein [Pirellulales bacterium]
MIDPSHPIAELLRRDRRYKLDAYIFVLDALRYAQEVLGLGTVPPGGAEESAEGEESEVERHVTGQELCEAVRLYALEQFGYMAQSVLGHWGVKRTSDFGEIVFNLIDIGHMRKTPHDRREDFDDVFDFEKGLRQNFQITLPE